MSERCVVCGSEKARSSMILRRLNGKEHFCCGVACETRWEKHNLVGVCG